MIEAVLWDNDGVLVDSERRFYEVSRSAFARLGLDLTEDIWVDQYLGKGVGSREIALKMGADRSLVDPVMNERNLTYRKVLEQAPPVRPHVRETLRKLAGHCRLAIVTGCHRYQLNLMHAASGLIDFFETIVTADDFSREKPDPEPYLEALRRLNLAAEKCVAVEDSKRGLKSALSAGIKCVVVPTDLTAGQNFEGALAVEKNVSGILNYIDGSPWRHQSVKIIDRGFP